MTDKAPQVIRLWRDNEALLNNEALNDKGGYDYKEEMKKPVTESSNDDEEDQRFGTTLDGFRRRYPGFSAYPRWFCQYLTESKYLKRYLTGLDLDVEVVDNCVNTLTLVNALVLTIPFGVLVDLGHGFWTELEEIMIDGGCEEWMNYYYFHTRNNILMVLYASIAAVIIATFYYVLRPDFNDRNIDSDQKKLVETMQSMLDFMVSGTPITEKQLDQVIDEQYTMKAKVAEYRFKAWWKNGRHAVLAIFILTSAAVISLLSFSFILISIFMVRREDLCEFNNTLVSSAFLCASGAITIYCIIRLNFDATISERDQGKLKRFADRIKATAEGRELEKLPDPPKGENCCCFPERKDVAPDDSEAPKKDQDLKIVPS